MEDVEEIREEVRRVPEQRGVYKRTVEKAIRVRRLEPLNILWWLVLLLSTMNAWRFLEERVESAGATELQHKLNRALETIWQPLPHVYSRAETGFDKQTSGDVAREIHQQSGVHDTSVKESGREEALPPPVSSTEGILSYLYLLAVVILSCVLLQDLFPLKEQESRGRFVSTRVPVQGVRWVREEEAKSETESEQTGFRSPYHNPTGWRYKTIVEQSEHRIIQ